MSGSCLCTPCLHKFSNVPSVRNVLAHIAFDNCDIFGASKLAILQGLNQDVFRYGRRPRCHMIGAQKREAGSRFQVPPSPIELAWRIRYPVPIHGQRSDPPGR